MSSLYVIGNNSKNSKDSNVSKNQRFMAAFDLDWTLVRSIHGKFFKSEDDWAILPNRLPILKYYADNGFDLVIFTNQKMTGQRLNTSLNRIQNIVSYLNTNGLYPLVYIATKNDNYRKPNIGMYQQYVLDTGHVASEYDFYVGDAAGRPGDFSDSDSMFAHNMNINFVLPEDIFHENIYISLEPHIPNNQYMIIFVGMAGSGKSTVYHDIFKPLGYSHASKDVLKTNPRMLKYVKQELSIGHSVVIDATNPKLEDRKMYLDICLEYGVPAIIIYFVGNGDKYNSLREKPTKVPQVAYNVYYKNLVEPSLVKDGVPVIQYELGTTTLIVN